MSPSTIKRIESGDLDLSPSMRTRIALATGVAADSLLNGQPLKRFTGDDVAESVFTEKGYIDYREGRTGTRDMNILKSEKRLDHARERFVAMSALMEAAWYANAFDQIIYLFDQWLLDSIKHFHLEKGYVQSAKQHRVSILQIAAAQRQRAQEQKDNPRRKQSPLPKKLGEDSSTEDGQAIPLWMFTPSQSPFGEWLRRRPLEQQLLDDLNQLEGGSVIPPAAISPHRKKPGICQVCGSACGCSNVSKDTFDPPAGTEVTGRVFYD